jgi:hypothetical protein
VTTDSNFYRTLKVFKTFEVGSADDITNIVTQLADHIEKDSRVSARILLPREGGNGLRARKWGVSLRSALILALKKKRVRLNLREVRYVHDKYHYGWILIEPSLLGSHLSDDLA